LKWKYLGMISVNKKRVLSIFGTRPEAIKMAPLVKEFRADSDAFESLVCVTAQHRRMLDQVLDIFEIVPDFDLNLMIDGQTTTQLIASIFENVQNVLQKSKPDLVLVHGDTTTALASAMCCFYNNVRVGHVEAGLRTFDLKQPFPEEFNRQVISKIASWHFCPTENNTVHLFNEGVNKKNIIITGNTVVDALLMTAQRLKEDKIFYQKTVAKVIEKIPFDLQLEQYVVITAHRRESFGSGLLQICEAVLKLSDKLPHINFVFPVHMNPQVYGPVHRVLGKKANVFLVEPLDYASFVHLIENCYFILTDSGGIQEEAPSLGKPVLVMRELTERKEAIAAGCVKLVGTKSSEIYENAMNLIENKSLFDQMSRSKNPYGEGDSSSKIVSFLKTIDY